ncbi:Penicillin-binding protein 2 OS=Streptomyces tendae OX=1932 GN=GUR47_14370 PE=3 SV=1 [Streptomyces tendae]
MFAKLGVDVGVRGMTATAEAFGFNDDGLRVPFPVARSTFDTSVDGAQLGYTGHRIGHESVWTVPYAHFFLDRTPAEAAR